MSPELDRIIRRGLRGVAIAVAVLGAVDPAITTNRATKSFVSVVGADSASVDRMAKRIEKRADVIRASLPVADASVIVGDAMPTPDEMAALARPVFAVREDPSTPHVSIENVRAPQWVPRAARVPVQVIVDADRARGRRLVLSLTDGAAVVAQSTVSISNDSARIPVSLGYIPTALGAARLRVSAVIDNARDSALADVVVDVRDVRWNVLVYDARPTWMSTFVRRALEQDPRFMVTSRVVTSRGVSTDVGHPPARLDNPSALDAFDAVVVGAPDALSTQDVAGLEAFLRRRGGGALLLLDHRAPGAYERLAGVTSWASDSGKAMTVFTPGDSIRAAELTWPAMLPAAAEALARARVRDSARAVVWRTNVGAGALVVSGALDAWRFRDRDASDAAPSGFDRFWRELVASVASGSPSAIDVRVARRTLRPGERTSVGVTVRNAALSSSAVIQANVTAKLSDGRPGTAIRLLPTARPGELVGELTVPSTLGTYRVNVSSGSAHIDVPLVVTSDAKPPLPAHADLLAAFAEARGGRVLDASVADIARTIVDAIHPPVRAVTWHPMRSVWWIAVFALAACGEWWLRRRRGAR